MVMLLIPTKRPNLPPRTMTALSIAGSEFCLKWKSESRVESPSTKESLKAIVCPKFNVFLVLVPISWWLHFVHPTEYKTIFACAFISKFPLANLLALAVDSLSMHVGDIPRGILHSTSGNAIEFIIALVALIRCEYQVVQSSLVGAIVNHLLLSVGMCFLWGGFAHYEQEFDAKAAEIDSWLLISSIMVVLFPAVLHATIDTNLSDPTEKQNILSVSHGVALVLLCIYAAFLVFMFISHKDRYIDGKRRSSSFADHEAQGQEHVLSTMSQGPDHGTSDGHDNRTLGEERPQRPVLNLSVATMLLFLVIATITVTALFMIDSVDGLSETSNVSKEFIAMILIPIMGNVPEHLHATGLAVKGRLRLSMAVVIGSGIQIALFIIPFVVCLAWWTHKPLTLLFDPVEAITLVVTAVVVAFMTTNGRSNWLEGAILIGLFAVIAVVFFYYNPAVSSVRAC
ncbi:hypothetical protein OE88DRAFT_898773 [Heliocybe sulcata]|uniref:Vacuolar calcium ion transporter n=1 Tax=Heliocybe sulcata TaxID=5364 RepID=A0A5C3MM72_9AGAM|nr:hypothetical protein OE88DRAFT_898773 [Heliocybe sulcata]